MNKKRIENIDLVVVEGGKLLGFAAEESESKRAHRLARQILKIVNNFDQLFQKYHFFFSLLVFCGPALRALGERWA